MSTIRRRIPGAGLGVLVAAVALVAACAGDDEPTGPQTLLDLPDAAPGEVVGLYANDATSSIEWLDRLDGTIRSLRLDDGQADGDPVELATVDVGTDGEQHGLLGQVVIDGRRFASWTQPDTADLVVGEIVVGAPPRLVWSAGEAGGGAIGGVLAELDERILLAIGRNTAFDSSTRFGGAVLTLEPDGDADQEPELLSIGYTNPWAVTVLERGDDADGAEIWVADNAAGPDPEFPEVDDVERIGRADLLTRRADMTRTQQPDRAPSAMVVLPDGRLGICGFLDGELRANEIVDGDEPAIGNPATLDLPRSEVVPAETIMPCLTGAAVFDDGTIVTVALGDPGLRLVVLRP